MPLLVAMPFVPTSFLFLYIYIQYINIYYICIWVPTTCKKNVKWMCFGTDALSQIYLSLRRISFTFAPVTLFVKPSVTLTLEW